MIKKIIFVFSKFFETKDWDIFGCPYFLEQGYDIEIWSLVQIYYAGKAKKPLHLFKDYKVQYFNEISRFQNKLQKVDHKQTIFIIYPSLGENPATGRLIRREIRKTGGRYCDYFYPLYFMDTVNEVLPGTRADITRYYLKHFRDKEKIKNLFFSFVYPPTYIFITARAKVRELANRYDVLNPYKLKYINTQDYDRFLSEDGEEDLTIVEKEGLQNNQYVVFLDEAHTHHSDNMNLGLKSWVTEEVYGKEIRNLLDFIEKQTGVDVVIALHPKAEYKDSSLYGGRRMIYGKSRALIKYSSIVITDISSAISYIMLYHKKMLLYTTDQLLQGEGYQKQEQLALAKFLGCEIVNASKELPSNLSDKYVKQADESKRQMYLKEFVCSRRKNRKMTSAQIINTCLREL